MTTAQLQLEAERLVNDFTPRQLEKIQEMIEDFLDAQASNRIMKRIKAGKEKLIPWEAVDAKLRKRFNIK